MYFSTRSSLKVSASKAIVDGLAPDGGLYIVDNIPKINLDDFYGLSYNEIAFRVFKLFLDDFTDEEINYSINSAYNNDNFYDSVADIKIRNDFSFLNLYQGPTFAFKDVALQILPYFMEIALKKQHVSGKMVILTATSGDTGSAALSGFSNIPSINTIVLYPSKGISEIQEKQMLSFRKNNAFPFAIDGNFDDCQSAVKEAFKTIKVDGINLSSANSINIGRLIPQIVYYIYSYIKLVNEQVIKKDEKINFVVPTGNFGNILACYIASEMGINVNKILCASNTNDVLTEFFNTGVYNAKREFHITNSPSMDILVSSNLERYLYLLFKDKEKVRNLMQNLSLNRGYEIDKNILNGKIIADSTNEKETVDAIYDCLNNESILIDPHTAVAYSCFKKNIAKLEGYTVVVSTASPLKFSKTICEAINIKSKDEFSNIEAINHMTKFKIDNRLMSLKNCKNVQIVWDKNDIQNKIKKVLEEIK